MRASTRRFAVTVLVVLGMTIAAIPVDAASGRQHSASSGPLTQTHTVFYNMGSCSHGTTYALVSWNTRFQRTAGADREISKVQYRELSFGYTCANNVVTYDTGFVTYHPKFGTKNDITWTLALNWPYISPVAACICSNQLGSYTRRSGGAVIATICNSVVFANIGDPTCDNF